MCPATENGNPPKTNLARQILQGVGYCLIYVNYLFLAPVVSVGGTGLLLALDEILQLEGTVKLIANYFGIAVGLIIGSGVAGNLVSQAMFTGKHKRGAMFGVGVYKERELAFIISTVIVACISMLLAAKAAMLLHSYGLTNYDFNFPGPLTFTDMAQTFLWYTLNMIPGLDIPGTINWERPVEPNGIWAGLPIILYKIWLIYFIFSKVRLFLKNRSEKKVAAKVLPVEGDVVEG